MGKDGEEIIMIEMVMSNPREKEVLGPRDFRPDYRSSNAELGPQQEHRLLDRLVHSDYQRESLVDCHSQTSSLSSFLSPSFVVHHRSSPPP